MPEYNSLLPESGLMILLLLVTSGLIPSVIKKTMGLLSNVDLVIKSIDDQGGGLPQLEFFPKSGIIQARCGPEI